jgi:thioredoxin 1
MMAEHRRVNTEKDPELEKIRRKKMEEMKAMAAEHSAEQSKPNTPIVAEDDNFDELVNKYPLIVVDCWAPWCGPCHMVSPIIEELARTYAGKVVFSKLNVDENPHTAGRFSIMSIPTLLIMRKGKEADRIVGALPKQVIEEKIRRYIE